MADCFVRGMPKGCYPEDDGVRCDSDNHDMRSFLECVEASFVAERARVAELVKAELFGRDNLALERILERIHH